MKAMVLKTIFAKETNGGARGDNRLILGSLILFAAGFFALLMGMIFTIVHAAVAGDALFNTLSSILFVTAFPLLFIGSHLLDVEREHRKNRRKKDLEF